MHNTTQNWQKTVGQFEIDIYESAGMLPGALADMLTVGVFHHNRRDTTVFLMFGRRLYDIQHARTNNNYFYADDMSDTTNIDHMLVGIQGFNKIVIVRDIPDVNLDGLFEALPIYPIKNKAGLHRQCGYSDVQLDYRKLARIFLDKQRWWYFADFWWWINKDAVDFTPTAIQQFELEQEFINATKLFDENLIEVQNMDLDVWRNKVCAAFAKKFNHERSGTRPNDHRRERTTISQKIHDNVVYRSDLQVDQSWMDGLVDMIPAIIDRYNHEEKCLLVPGGPNDNCQFSIIKLWQVAQILMEIDIMVYEKRTFKKFSDMLFVFSILLIVVLTVPSLAFGLAKLCWFNIITLLHKALTPTKVGTRGQSAQGRSPARAALTPTKVGTRGQSARGRSPATRR